MTHLEIEFKTLLDFNTYQRLKDMYFSDSALISQNNIYVDTDAFEIRAQYMMLRLRVINGLYMMTLKKPVSGGILEFDGTIEVPKDNNFSGVVPSEIREQLTLHGIDVDDLKIQGELHTERFETRVNAGLLVLDKSTYLDVVDYELEFEADAFERGQAYFKQFLVDNDIMTKSDLPKSERFYRTLYKEKVE